jgi:hypothetical protein
MVLVDRIVGKSSVVSIVNCRKPSCKCLTTQPALHKSCRWSKEPMKNVSGDRRFRGWESAETLSFDEKDSPQSIRRILSSGQSNQPLHVAARTKCLGRHSARGSEAEYSATVGSPPSTSMRSSSSIAVWQVKETLEGEMSKTDQ